MITKLVYRNLMKRPFLNLIKILGLSLSLCGVLIIALFLKNESSYDCFHSKHNRIFRFTITNPNHFGGKHFARIYNAGFVPDMVDYFPEIEKYVRLLPIRSGAIKYQENFIKVNQAFQCDSTFFSLFDAQLLIGDPKHVLNKPGSLVITESFAEKTFGGDNPIGKVLSLPEGQYNGKKIDFTVSGIMEDFPQYSHFHPDFIAHPIDKSEFNGWAFTYLLLKDTTGQNIANGFKNFYALHHGKPIEDIKTCAHLQNIADIHLYSDKYREIEKNSCINVVYTLAFAALILFIIALSNYASLNIGMLYFCEKFMFVSNVTGSSRWMKLKYFFIENMLLFFASVLLSMIIVGFAGFAIQNQFISNLFEGNELLVCLVLVLFGLSSIIVNILPLLKPIIVRTTSKMKGRSRQNYVMSKGLIVLQYSISIVLIVAVIIINRQTNFALENSMGAENEKNIICFENVHSDIQKKFEIFKAELLQYSSIEAVSAMMDAPGGEANDKFRFELEGFVNESLDNTDLIGVLPCDYSFASIFKLHFVSGNNFSKVNIDNEGSGEFIINESVLKKLDYSDPSKIIGKNFRLIQNYSSAIPSGKIIGVLKDFHLSNVKKDIEPLVLFKRDVSWINNFIVSVKPGMKDKALSDIKYIWEKLFHGYPFQYSYVDAMYQNVYKTELLQVKILSFFTFLAIFICSMGLLGISLLVTQRRTKEIGIRKVNGARGSETLMMLNISFLKWITVSILLGIPIAYFLMNRWLANYAYKTPLSWWIFALSGFIVISTSVLTVSYNAYKVSNRNPVDALRYE